MPALRLLLPLLLMASCGGPPAPTPASEAVVALIEEFEAFAAELGQDEREELGLASLESFKPSAWKSAFIGDLDSGFFDYDAETVVLLALLANEGSVGEQPSSGVWAVQASTSGESWVELLHESGQRYRAQLEETPSGWRCLQLDPVFPALTPEDDSAEALAIALSHRLIEIDLAMPGTQIGDDWFYAGFSGNSILRELQLDDQEWFGLQGEPAGLPVINVIAPRFFGYWREGLAKEWEQSLEIARAELLDDGQVEVVIRLVQRRPESTAPRSLLMSFVFKRERTGWKPSREPKSLWGEAVFEFEFKPGDERSHLMPPKRF